MTSNAQTGAAPSFKPSFKFRFASFGFGLLVKNAHLTIECQGCSRDFTAGDSSAKDRYVMAIAEPDVMWSIITNPDPGIGELYMDGKWWLREGDVGQFMVMLATGRDKLFGSPFGKLIAAAINRHPDDAKYDHSIENSYDQIQHHYDIGNELYGLFLDEGMNYSCAFFESKQQSLRDAQLNKIKTSIKRLDIKPGMNVLDIGCGWGETTRTIANTTGANTYGVTLAETQLALSKDKVERMDNKPIYHLSDYREHAKQHIEFYDRIISIGMFEHVGNQNFHEYFKAIYDQLKPGGLALVHSIVKPAIPTSVRLSSPWLEKYIFPGGCLCRVEEMVEEATQQGLTLAHEPFIHESFHYAETLRRWRANFLSNLEHLDPQKYDQRFINMWIYYLAMCEGMFEGAGYRIAQVLLKKPE